MKGRWHALVIGMGMMVLAGGMHGESRAAEWSAEPSLAVKGEYNSNLILTTGPHDATYGHWVSPGVKFGGSTENFEMTGKAAADFVQYYGGIDRGLTNLYFPLSVKYRSHKEILGFDGGFTRDNTLRGELLQTGVVLSFTQRNLLNLAPSWTHMFTELLSLQGTYNYAKATYEEGAQLGLFDYDVHGGSLALLYRLSESDRVQLIGNYTNFSVPDASGTRNQIAGGQVALTHSFSETISATLSGGPQVVIASIQPGPTRLSETSINYTVTASLRKQWDDGYAELIGSRELRPSGFGLLIQTRKVAANVAKDLTESLTLSLNGQFSLASSASSEATATPFPTNRYVFVTPGLTWKFHDWWSINMAYTYGRRDVDSLDEMAISNAATVMLTYYPPRFTVGR